VREELSLLCEGRGATVRWLEQGKTVRLFLRLTLTLLTLSCLTAIATLDPGGPGVASIQAKLGTTIPAELRAAHAERGDAHGKFRTDRSNVATLEDGPEGEQIPRANLVRGYDGGDQIEAAFERLFVRFATSLANASCKPVELSHPPCAGFPTGPPVA
jgi:hypothetical protein